jgi:hypothetical protein
VTSSGDRYARQRILQEIGSEGQIRLSQASILAPNDLSQGATRAFCLYAKRAGLTIVENESGKGGSMSPACQNLAQLFRHEESRHLGQGAAACLEAIHQVLRSPSSATES